MMKSSLIGEEEKKWDQERAKGVTNCDCPGILFRREAGWMDDATITIDYVE